MALLVVLTGTTHPGFALFPAFTNSLLLVAAGIAEASGIRFKFVG